MKTLHPLHNFLLPTVAAFLLLPGLSLPAQTWDGGGVNNDWTTALNWNPDAVPANNGTANIVFSGTTRLAPNLNVAQDISSLTFGPSAGAFTIGGAALTIRSGGITNNAGTIETITAPIVIPSGAAQTWRGAFGLYVFGPTLSLGSSLTLNQPFLNISANVSGSGSWVLNGSTVYLYGINTYSGPTTLNGSYLSTSVNNSLSPNSSIIFGTNSALELQSGAIETIGGLAGTNGTPYIYLDGNSSLTVRPSSSPPNIFNGIISGGANATLMVDGSAGIGGAGLSLGGSNTLSGTIRVVNGGRLSTVNSERLADTANLVVESDLTSFDVSQVYLGPTLSNFTFLNVTETVASVTLNLGGDIAVTAWDIPPPFTPGSGIVICDTFTCNGGRIFPKVTIVNRGTFVYNQGWIGGRVVNQGGINPGANLDVYFGDGLANFTTLALPATGEWTFNGQGLDNQSFISLANSTLNGNGGLTNNNQISGFGTIGGSGGFVNNGLLSAGGGNLTLENTGANSNFGNIDLVAGLELRLNGAALNNGGTINLNGATLTGSAALNNNAGGTVIGRGTIACPFNNVVGMVLRDSGTLNILQGFANSGEIQLSAAAAGLSGGAIANNGTIQGLGSIGNGIANNGTIEAIGGTLTLSGSVANYNNGLISALSGGKILVSSGIASQAGVISLDSGTFDNNGRALNNTGQISGYGTFRSGGLANNGSITFSGGLSTINGNVTNQATRRISVAYNPALFTGMVVNNGTFKVTSTTATFAGTYIENGTFSSDPATNYFINLIVGPSGQFQGATGDSFSISGDLQNGSAQNVLWDTRDAELVFRGGSSHTFYLPGSDLGPNYSGLITNFAWKTFRLGSGEALALRDGNGTSGAALYTRNLILEGGLGQISSITGNGFKIYYDPRASGNGYLGGGTYNLAGGGAIIPLNLPAIQINAISRLNNGSMKLNCAGIPDEPHSVLASTNMVNWQTIGSATAADDGTFTFTDANALSFGNRFYRLSSP